MQKITTIMKARIKKTGEVVNIASYATVTLDKCDSWGNPIELGFDEVEILQNPKNKIDWEQRRYEIAKEVFASMYDFSMNGDVIATQAIFAADKLIVALKKKKRGTNR